MTSTDPATGGPLPDSAIQRILFIANDVHIYQIPPLASTKGFSASSWTSQVKPTAQQIFTARIRIIETSVEGRIKADVVLEDPGSGNLFAAAPYTSVAVVQQALDSSRFFAVRVVGERGMKATLGIGFEDRSPAFDFAIALGEVRKVLGWETGSGGTAGGISGLNGAMATKGQIDGNSKQDFSLKEGEKIHIQVGNKGRRQASESSDTQAPSSYSEQTDGAALFSIAPPPPGAGKVGEPTAPSSVEGKSAEELGFDDGEFGEFQ
ncbi:adaptin ear-binding coat-associated protein 1 NECAP-1 [Polychaeton citri CBS 116435]|uniref:Adaptin ear-binding coat-associated protein 1 NECAP-1 n=1 Tax=Polychaeton citri CBS 116435 TaxID=1314669 RepID=A0A9P4QCR4_9PEZI|nr:adaptin ear-binding coat-associated protein 1 NECAP-1 [Polychaeton citri CBS 116435]